MTVFVSYQPGAKGSFISEICDLSVVPDDCYNLVNREIHAGNTRWLTKSMLNYLNEHNLSGGSYNGIYPQEIEENYTRYVDTVLEAVQFLNSKFTINTHYTDIAPLNYILSKGAKVIRIITTEEQHTRKLADNYFFKNFINDNTEGSNVARHVIRNTVTSIKEKFNYDFFDKPLKEWDKESLRILYDISALSTTKLQEAGVIVHENLLEVKSNELTSIDILSKIVEFAGGNMNDLVRARIEEYNKAQLDITTFDEYIEEFLNN